MRLKQINALILAALMLWQFAGLDLLPADLDRSGRVDLRDAIVAVQNLHSVADEENTATSGASSLAREFRMALRVFDSAVKRMPTLESGNATERGPSQAFLALVTVWHLDTAGAVSCSAISLSDSLHSTFPEYPTPPPRSVC
jgi:hypothetical protein